MPHSSPQTPFRVHWRSPAAAAQDSISTEADGKCLWQVDIMKGLRDKAERLRKQSRSLFSNNMPSKGEGAGRRGTAILGFFGQLVTKVSNGKNTHNIKAES